MTNVIFRKWKDDIIAIFPDIPGKKEDSSCTSYMKIGQHSTCNPQRIIEESHPATREEYHNLLEELHAMGYDDLEVITQDRLLQTMPGILL
jgi:hypothetical protein